MNRLATINKPKITLDTIFDEMENIGRNLWMIRSPFERGDFYQDINFPKYNLRKTDDGLAIDIALAGYDKDHIDIELSPQNKLTVSSEKIDESDTTYYQRDIALRKFSIDFQLSPSQEIGEITFINGILSIPIISGDPKRDVKRLEIL